MTEMNARIAETVRRFCCELKQMGIECDQVLLFGSQARGTAREGSDIDLFVISEAWAPYSERERLEMLVHRGINSSTIPAPRRSVTGGRLST